ncbi:hypothetical protein LA080_008265 [Diaporthe eres]|nr:hypothetical protein LA080_008265 [Diaporthe eres]
MFQGDGRRELVHKVYKVKITEDHITRDSQLDKRAKNQCPTNYNLCASSLGGDCCPNNYACAKDSCYATTAAVSTCAGRASYYACPLDVGGGCCPQGLVCGANQACSPPAGATYSQTCDTGFSLCAASLGGGCCKSGMACGSTACYNPSPSTTVVVVATTQGSSATTITSTSVFTPTAEPSDSGADVVAKIFPSTYPKQATTEGDDSSGGGGSSGLSKGVIGGIVGGAAAVLVIFLAVAYFLVKRLNKTKRAVESRRETTSGSGTRQTAEKKSATQVSITRLQPTPSEVDAMDCDPLMVSSSVASPRGQQQYPRPGNGRSRSGSDAPSQPSEYSSSAAGPRWNTPSVDSDGGDSTSRGYFSLPARVHNQLGGRDARRASEASSQYSYHRFAHGGRHHGRNYSNASELSAGSDELGSQQGLGSPLIGPTAVELSNDGGFVPELPGSDTETESNGPHGANGRRPNQTRTRSTSVVSPMSITAVNKPPLTHGTFARRRGNSAVSPMDGQNGNGGRGRSDSSTAPEQRLGSIDESATAAAPPTNSMHGYFGSPTTAVGQTAAGTRAGFDTPPLPGYVSLGLPSSGNQAEQGQDEK